MILDPWASWGVADRIAELAKLLVEWFFKGLGGEGTERALRRTRCGAGEAEVNDLAEEGIGGTMAEARHSIEGRDVVRSCGLIVV